MPKYNPSFMSDINYVLEKCPFLCMLWHGLLSPLIVVVYKYREAKLQLKG